MQKKASTIALLASGARLLFSSLWLRSTTSIYDHFAADYEELFGSSQAAASSQILDYVREQSMRPKTAIDLGCGTGILTRALADYVERVVGGDSSEEMLCRARGTGGGGKIEYAKMNALRIGNLGQRYDMVTALGLLPHIPRDRFMDWVLEVHDVLTERGLLLIGIPAPPWRLLGVGASKAGHSRIDAILGALANTAMSLFKVEVDFWYLNERHIARSLTTAKLNFRIARRSGLKIIDIRR